MLSREDIIKYITKCVDCAMPILQDENGLDVSRGYSFMLDKDKKAKIKETMIDEQNDDKESNK